MKITNRVTASLVATALVAVTATACLYENGETQVRSGADILYLPGAPPEADIQVTIHRPLMQRLHTRAINCGTVECFVAETNRQPPPAWPIPLGGSGDRATWSRHEWAKADAAWRGNVHALFNYAALWSPGNPLACVSLYNGPYGPSATNAFCGF